MQWGVYEFIISHVVYFLCLGRIVSWKMKHVLSILTLMLISITIGPCRGQPDHSGMNLHMAKVATETAIKKEIGLGTKMNIAVVDVGTNLLSFARMDDSYITKFSFNRIPI